MTRSPTLSGSAISERVSGRSGLSKKTASAPTSSATRGFPVPATVPTMPTFPTASRWPRASIRCPPSEEAARRTAYSRASSTRKMPAW
jgi:hypothetical protein